MLIFGDFPSELKLQEYVTEMSKYEKDIIVCRNQEEFDKHDTFSRQLYFPVVLIARGLHPVWENEIIESVWAYGGIFIGNE